MNVVSFDPQAKAHEERKSELLEVLEEMRKRIEEGEIKEFVAASVTKEGDVQIHASILDLPGGVGLFEIGKLQLIQLTS
jgi:hypothetical protein